MHMSKYPRRYPRAGLVRALVLAVLLAAAAHADPEAAEIFDTVENEGARFLSVYPDPRGEAMGQAASAAADGLAGVCWNPAGLAFSSSIEVVEQGHLVDAVDWDVDWADHMDFTFVGVSVPIGPLWKRFPLGTFAVWRIRASFDDIVRAAGGFGVGDSEIDLGDLRQQAFGVSYAQPVFGHFSVGVTCKHVESHWPGAAWCDRAVPPVTGDYDGMGWDIGLMYRRSSNPGGRSGLTVSAAAGERNIGSLECQCGRRESEYKLPRGHFLGIAPSLYIMDRAVTVTLSVELRYKDRTMDWSLGRGAEITFLDGLALRWGRYEGEQETATVTTRGFGLGLRYGKAVAVAYDWAESHRLGSQTGDIDRHMLTIRVVRCDRGIDLRSILSRYAGIYR